MRVTPRYLPCAHVILTFHDVALRAMPDSGTITIYCRASSQVAEATYRAAWITLRQGARVIEDSRHLRVVSSQ